MPDKSEDKNSGRPDSGRVTWGPKLFLGAVAVVLAFFYWLLIYSGGVTVYHG